MSRHLRRKAQDPERMTKGEAFAYFCVIFTLVDLGGRLVLFLLGLLVESWQ